MRSAGGEAAAIEERVWILVRTAFEAMVLVDDERRFIFINERAAELFGAPAEVILGRRLEEFTSLEGDGALEGLGPLLRHDGSHGVVEYRARWNFGPSVHLLVLREVGAPARSNDGHDGQVLPRLTPREQQVLQLAADGRSTEEIAGVLVLSPATVKTHFHRIYGKLDARDRVAAVAVALRLGVIT